MSAPSRILVVDDDEDIRTLLGDYLRRHGFDAEGACDGAAMRERLRRAEFDLVVLDLTLPREDGLDVCRDLRTRSDVPVIMLTARGAPIDRSVGLEIGADDYVAKPFEPRELLARIRAVLRRTTGKSSAVRPEATRHIRFAAWTFDPTARHIVNAAGVIVALSGSEFRLLRAFLEHPRQVLSRDRLLALTSGSDDDAGVDAFDRSIDLQVSRLRQKLRDDAKAPLLIKTIRSEGYMFACHVTVPA
jgi:two-component system OmpR family response regulator